MGEEALGIAIYCASIAPDFLSAVTLAVNHNGDSDTTGSLVGQLLGARDGEDAIPAHLVRELELRDTITAISDDLTAFPGCTAQTRTGPGAGIRAGKADRPAAGAAARSGSMRT